MEPTSELTYGLLVEFEDTGALLSATRKLHGEGWRCMEAYTPFPVEGLAEALGFERTRMPLVVLIGALIGGGGGYLLQWWASVIAYPVNIGGRPLHSWPAFIPVTFELTILVAALFAVLGMLGLNGLPRPHHPLFAVESFSRASTDRYFLCIQAVDPKYDEAALRELLAEFPTVEIQGVSTIPA